MDNSVDFTVAIDFLNRKIAELNIEISLNKTGELLEKRREFMELRKKVYDGDYSVVRKIINGEII